VTSKRGIHFCYGDWRAKHFVEPIDAGKMVTLTNAIMKAVSRPIAYVHMPVPIDRSDDAFFRPLAELKLKKDTELYLGVVHADGPEGVKRRADAARKYVSDFDIATECGMARSRKPDFVMSLLKQRRGVQQSRFQSFPMISSPSNGESICI
jgi:hypothetical protein